MNNQKLLNQASKQLKTKLTKIPMFVEFILILSLSQGTGPTSPPVSFVRTEAAHKFPENSIAELVSMCTQTKKSTSAH